MYSCNQCGRNFTRHDNLKRHTKLHCTDIYNKDTESRNYCKRIKLDSDEQEPQNKYAMKNYFEKESTPSQTPTFDGAEFSGTKPKSRETLHRMMEMLKIPDHRRERIATEILKEDRDRARTRTDLSNFINEDEIDESAGEGDVPLNESDLIELLKRYKTLQSDLIQKGRRQNVPELLNILNVLLESDVVNQADYVKMNNRIKGYL